MAIGKTVWGPKVPTLKGTEGSLSYVQCFFYLASSLINVSIFHIIWLHTFWTGIIYYSEIKKILKIKRKSQGLRQRIKQIAKANEAEWHPILWKTCTEMPYGVEFSKNLNNKVKTKRKKKKRTNLRKMQTKLSFKFQGHKISVECTRTLERLYKCFQETY